MKIAFLLATLTLSSVATLPQGGIAPEFEFNNRALPQNDARFVLATDPAGTSSVTGPDYHVALQVFSVNDPLQPLAPDPSTTTFRSGAAAGYVNPMSVTVPGTQQGENISVIVQVYKGETWDTASYRYEGAFPGIIGPGARLLVMGTTPLVVSGVPEPSAALLGLVGMGVLVATQLRTVRG